jgi:hypothetical protein
MTTRRRSTILDADVARMVRVAKKAGAVAVDVKLDGAEFRILLVEPVRSGDKPAGKVAKKPAALI